VVEKHLNGAKGYHGFIKDLDSQEVFFFLCILTLNRTVKGRNNMVTFETGMAKGLSSKCKRNNGGKTAASTSKETQSKIAEIIKIVQT